MQQMHQIMRNDRGIAALGGGLCAVGLIGVMVHALWYPQIGAAISFWAAGTLVLTALMYRSMDQHP